MNVQAEIEQKQQLLELHRRNLRYLEQQSVLYGRDLPLAVHNALTTEQEAIASLERELVELGIAPHTNKQWQALLVDSDSNWRKIIAQNISQLGGYVVEQYHIPTQKSAKIVEGSDVAIVGVPNRNLEDPLTQQWIRDAATLGGALPIILLACQNNRDIAIASRRAIGSSPNNALAITLFKDNFDPRWFSRVVHKMLIQ